MLFHVLGVSCRFLVHVKHPESENTALSISVTLWHHTSIKPK